MDWYGTNDFLSVDADLELGQARSLAKRLTPRFFVVRMHDSLAAGDEDEDTEPAFFVVDVDAISKSPPSTVMTSKIGDFVHLRQGPALVIDTDDGWVAGTAALGRSMGAHAVVLGDDGIVVEVVPNMRLLDVVGAETVTTPLVLPNELWRHVHPEHADVIVQGVTVSGGGGAGEEAAGDAEAAGGDNGGGGDNGESDDGGGGDDGGDDGRDDEAMALDVRFPDTVQLGDTATLLVLLTLGPGGPGSAPITATSGEVLEIMASPTAGFTLEDASVKRMTVVVDGETLPVKFDLVADVVGKGSAKVFAWRKGDCVAALTVSASIVSTPVAVPGGAPTTVPLPATVKAVADLELMVLLESYRGGDALRYHLRSDRSTSDFGPQPLDGNPSRYVQTAFGEIQGLGSAPAFGNAERMRLERIGADLYESLVPPDLQEVLWHSDRVHSFLIQTEEPWIPWEVCRMTSTRDGRTESRGFLCELFDMSRWLPAIQPKTALRATRVGVLAPLDSGLPSRQAEVDMLQALSGSGPAVESVKATYESTLTALGSHRYDVLHFIGHGQNVDPDNATRSEIKLSGRWRLTPSDISGETRNLGVATPIVFVNACQGAQASMALSGVGGWAAALTRAGAGAFVGAHWDVRDDLAHLFATEFYARLVKGATVAGAVRKARTVLRDRADGDATWLAYSVHASPGASCTFAAPTA